MSETSESLNVVNGVGSTYAVMNTGGNSQWVSDKDLESLRVECATMYAHEQPLDTAERKLKESAPIAVLRLAHIAAHGDPGNAVKASSLILDYTLGNKKRQSAGQQSPVEMAKELYEQAVEMSESAVKPWETES